MKKTHSSLAKFKVAMAALTGQPLVETCKQYEIGNGLVYKWKKQLKEHGAMIFRRRESKDVATNWSANDGSRISKKSSRRLSRKERLTFISKHKIITAINRRLFGDI